LHAILSLNYARAISMPWRYPIYFCVVATLTLEFFVIYFLLNSLIIIQTPSNDDAFCIGYIMPNSHPAIPSKPFLASQR
tara:strand:- start:229 stop:465 length:237 start_codon:yes stop_codon:yes gene_type:complete